VKSLGWLPDPDTGVAQDYSASQLLKASVVPKNVDNRDLVRVLAQGKLGSCTANAALQAVRASHIIAGAPDDVEFGSRLFAYFWARAITHQTGEDSGTWLRAIFEILNKFGFPPESAWPYDDGPDAFKKMPGMRAMRAAYDQSKPTEYRKIYETGDDRIRVIKRALANRQLVCFGTDVTEDFCDNRGIAGEVVHRPSDGAEMAGGHAMTIVGYEGNEFDIVNSWGEDWGSGGFFRAADDYLTWDQSRDFWVVKSAPRFSSVIA